MQLADTAHVPLIRRYGGPLTGLLAAALLAGAAVPGHAGTVAIETARGQVEAETSPQRVVVFDMAAIDTLDALGVTPVGVPENLFVDYLGHVSDAAETVGTLFEPDFEAVAALEPDLIVVGGRSSTQYDALARIAPVIDMTIDGDDLVAIGRDRLAAYGALFGKEAEAAALDATLDADLAAARSASAGRGNALILMSNGPKVSAYGPGSRFGWIHSAIGIPPAVADVEAATHGEAISFEFVHEANPDWLIVVDRAAAIGEDAANARETLDNPLVAGTTAWTEGQVVYLDPAPIYIAGGGLRSLTGVLHQVTAAFGE